MDFNLDALLDLLTGQVVPLVGILIGLLVVWVLARFVAFLVRRGLERTNLDEWVTASFGSEKNVSRSIGTVVFWSLFVFLIWQMGKLIGGSIGVAQTTFDPFGALFTEWVPRLVNVAVFLVVALIVANILKFLVVRVLNVTRLDERLGEKVAKGKTGGVNEAIGRAVFWLTFIVFVPSILGALGLSEASSSVGSLVGLFLSVIPNFIGAVIILVLGSFLARIVRQVATGFLESVGVDAYGARVGLSKAQNAQPLSMLLGTVVYVLVMVTVVGQALAALHLDVLTGISDRVLGSVTNVILSAIGATVVLFVAYYVAKFVAEVTSSLLAGIGFDRLPAALGFKTAKGSQLSSVIGYVVMVAVMLLAVQGTAASVHLDTIAALVGVLLAFGGHVLLGIVIFIAGIYLANIASSIITSTGGSDATFLANLARWAILIFVAGIALEQAGVSLAGDVITILLFAVGLAAALAFGLGGRDAAGKQVEKWFNRK